MSLMYAQMGFAVGEAALSHAGDRIDTRMQRMQRDYTNTMAAISAAQQLNTLTENEVSVRDASVRAEVAIDVQSLRDRADAEAGAAAAGVVGGSVKAAMRGLMRSRLQAKHAQKQRVEAQAKTNQNNRRNVALAKAFNKDVSVIPQPSSASALLGLGASVIDIYDSHQPEGQRISDTLAGIGR